MSDVCRRLRERLASLAPLELQIEDESHLHAGHAGAAGGGAHLRVRLVAPVFAGKSTVERHRLVYAAAGDLMRQDIHALAIRALSPEET